MHVGHNLIKRGIQRVHHAVSILRSRIPRVAFGVGKKRIGRDRFVRNGAAEVVQNLGVLDSLIMLEAATTNPAGAKVAMLQRIAAAGGVRFTESLVERAGPVVGPRVRRLLDTMGLEHVGAV